MKCFDNADELYDFLNVALNFGDILHVWRLGVLLKTYGYDLQVKQKP
jgi:hypothetical protein